MSRDLIKPAPSLGDRALAAAVAVVLVSLLAWVNTWLSNPRPGGAHYLAFYAIMAVVTLPFAIWLGSKFSLAAAKAVTCIAGALTIGYMWITWLPGIVAIPDWGQALFFPAFILFGVGASALLLRTFSHRR